MQQNFGTLATKKAEKMFKERKENVDIRFRKSVYNSSHIFTLIALKSGLRMWHKKSTEDSTKVLGYKNVISLFNRKKKRT
jgi:glutaredoxin 2